MIKLTKISLLIAGIMVTTAAFADAEEGKEMFAEAKCMECHNTEDFSNSKKVHNFKQIEKRVEACRINAGIGWFEEDVTSVADYLNQEFYKFKK